jgi:hypothetical protein
MTHNLKIHPAYFDPVRLGQKTFEIRLNDRPFEVGNKVVFCEFESDKTGGKGGGYTGRYIEAWITYKMACENFHAIAPGYCVFSFALRPSSCDGCKAGMGVDDVHWPSRNGGTVCQTCWERECSELWWKHIEAMHEAGLLEESNPGS